MINNYCKFNFINFPFSFIIIIIFKINKKTEKKYILNIKLIIENH